MSMEDVIESIEYGLFSRCMNAPQEGWNVR